MKYLDEQNFSLSVKPNTMNLVHWLLIFLQFEESSAREGHGVQADGEEAQPRGEGEPLQQVGDQPELQAAEAAALAPHLDKDRHGACERERCTRFEDGRASGAGAGHQGDVWVELLL